MPDISNNTLFTSVIAMVVLLFVGTLASVITSALMFGFNNWLKVSTKDVKTLETRVRQLESQDSLRAGDIKKVNLILYQISLMMVDASNMTLGPEEISKKIRDRLEKTGLFKKESLQ